MKTAVSRLLVGMLLASLLGCSSETRVELKNDNGLLSLVYACTEAGPRRVREDVAPLVRQVVTLETAEHILATSNPLTDAAEAAHVREARERPDLDAFELAVASYVCAHGHPPTRPPRFPEPGSQPPDFTTRTVAFDGSAPSAVRLSDLRGRTVVLVFWSTWCPPCREEYAALQALSARWDRGPVSVYAILHADTQGNLRRWRQQHGGGVAFLEDEGEAIARLYRVYGIPHSVIVRPDGRLHVSGHVGDRELERVVEAAMRFTSGTD